MKQSLQGLRILNTRPKNQAQTLSKQIADAGGFSIECPTLEIKELAHEWINFLPDLGTVNHAIFISANSVHHCFAALQANKIIWSKQINVIAIGQGSASALKQYNIQVNEIPELPNSEHLLALNSLKQLDNQNVLLFKGEGGRLLIEENLVSRGAHVFKLLVYKREIPEIRHQFIDSIWRNNLVDIILFTSEQSMHNLFNMFGTEARYWLQNKPCLVISERLAKSASFLGIKEIISSHPDRIVSTLFDYTCGE